MLWRRSALRHLVRCPTRDQGLQETRARRTPIWRLQRGTALVTARRELLSDIWRRCPCEWFCLSLLSPRHAIGCAAVRVELQIRTSAWRIAGQTAALGGDGHAADLQFRWPPAQNNCSTPKS